MEGVVKEHAHHVAKWALVTVARCLEAPYVVTGCLQRKSNHARLDPQVCRNLGQGLLGVNVPDAHLGEKPLKVRVLREELARRQVEVDDVLLVRHKYLLDQLAVAVVDHVLHHLGLPAGEVAAARHKLAVHQLVVGDLDLCVAGDL